MLFININNKIASLKFDASGYTVLAISTTNLPPNVFGSRTRGEMEVVEYFNTTLNQLQYRVAIISQQVSSQSVYYAEIDYVTGNIISSTEKTYIYPFGTELKGLEFSPDQNFMYVTHNLPFSFSYVDYFDVNLPTLLRQGLNITNSFDFRKSQIELGKDGKLYFASNNRLATLNNPNNPTTPIWVDNALPIIYNSNLTVLAQPFLESFILPDQIDGMDYTASFNSSVACCLSFTDFMVEENQNEEHFGTQTWSTGATNNPFNSATGVVTVKEKLVIKSGANITINNMVFEFASDAKLIIENGAKLTINNTTLTVNFECNPAAMWQGVEVWGTGTGSFQGTTSGWFTANNSLIEHALEGAVNFRRVDPLNTDPSQPSPSANNGGIIRTTNTTFRNNAVDVAFNPYVSMFNGNVINDLSRFTNSVFITDNTLNNPNAGGIVHARLLGVNGINFSGCDFKNTAPQGTFAFLSRGLGIRSANSKTTVNARCLNLTNPCTSLDKSTFENLTNAIRASSINPSYTVKVTQSEFKNNWRGIFLSGLIVPEVTDNHFEVGESFNNLITPTTVSYGLYLSQCTGYKVENNTLVSPISPTINDAYLGIYAFQSGTNNNEIYRNTFTNLKVGIQVAGVNGSTNPLSIFQSGLEFRCNKFFETDNFDILVSSGRVKKLQGLCTLNPTSPANNFFSFTVVTGGGDFWMDNSVTQNSIYTFSDNNSTLVPRLGFYNTNNTTLNLCLAPAPKFIDDNKSCPKRVPQTRAQLTAALSNMKITLDSLTGLIDAGSTQTLLNLIATQSGGNVKNALLAASPYLTDDVLLAYLATHPSNGHLQQILLANSPLSEAVAAYFATMNVPKGIKNQINNAQTGVSDMELLSQEIAFTTTEIERTENDLIRELLFDEVTNDGFKLVEDFLMQNTARTNTQEQLLALVRIANQDSTAARVQLGVLDSNAVNADFCKLHNTVVDVMNRADGTMALTTDSAKATLVGEVADATTNQQEVANAQALLENVGLRIPYNEVIEIVAPQTGNNLRLGSSNNETNATSTKKDVVTLYPNPANGQITIAHNLETKNGNVSIQIMDIMGRVLFNKTINNSNNNIDIKQLSSGLYFFTVSQNGNVLESGKLVVE